jgi:hypothetical protein
VRLYGTDKQRLILGDGRALDSVQRVAAFGDHLIPAGVFIDQDHDLLEACKSPVGKFVVALEPI